MKTAFIFLTTGFEEMEVTIPVDILRRGGINVTTVSLESEKLVIGAHQIPILADELFSEIIEKDADILIIPGGTTRIAEHANLRQKIADYYQQNKNIAAICAAPMIFGQLGILKGKPATCYPGFEKYLEGANLVNQATAQSGNIITGQGPAKAIEFGLLILKHLTDQQTSENVAKQILFK